MSSGPHFVNSEFIRAIESIAERWELPMKNFFRVAVVDDHPLFRGGVISVLASAGDIEVVGQGATAADALKIAQELAPDVVLLDINMPGGGIQAAAGIAG